MRDNRRIIFPSDRDMLEDEDLFRDNILSKCDIKTDGKQVVRVDFDNTSCIVHCRIDNGMLSGLVKCYDLRNNLLSITQYRSNVKHGFYAKYDVNGWVSCVGLYQDGNCSNVWKYYDEDGNVIKTTIYS